MHDFDINPGVYNSDFGKALLVYLTGFKQLFHFWLILYSGFLLKKGVLK